MKKEIITENLLQKMDEGFQKMNERFEKIDTRFQKMDDRFDELTIITKMSFDDLEQKVEHNTQHIMQVKETVTQTNDHLCRVELTMIQEFTAVHLQQNRVTSQLDRQAKRIKKLETGSR